MEVLDWGSNFASAFNWKGVVNVLGNVAPSIAINTVNFVLKREIVDVKRIPIERSLSPTISPIRLPPVNLPTIQNLAPKKLQAPPPDVPWMKVARSQLDVKEETDNNDGPDVEKYLKTVGLGKGYAWCGAFVNWNLKQVGIKGTQYAARALSWSSFGQKLDKPAYGAIATKTRKGGGHVGFVAGVTSNGRIVLLGGNQGDRVKYESFPASQLKYNYPTGYTPNYSLPKINAGSNVKMQ